MSIGESLKQAKRPRIQVKIYSAFTTYFDGPAYSISAVNHTGPFDILPSHKNFITVLSPCDVSVVTLDSTKVQPIASGVMHVRRDMVTVYVDV